MGKIGASEGIRTLDVHLGKVMLYQTELRSLPWKQENRNGTRFNCKSSFLFEVVNDRALANALENLFHEIDMHRMHLIIVLRLS